MKLYSALYQEFHPFDQILPEWEPIVVGPENELKDPGALIIWGGGDIHPSLYLRDNVGSHVGHALSQRDAAEAKLFTKAVERGLTIFGVCRGAQLGCALSGGILVQNVSGHGYDHLITTIDEKTIPTVSIHHQMMYPWNIEHELIAWTNYPKSQMYEGITEDELEKWPTHDYGDKNLPVEPEIVWFPTTKCLAVQGHPEMEKFKSSFNQYLSGLVKSKCG